MLIKASASSTLTQIGMTLPPLTLTKFTFSIRVCILNCIRNKGRKQPKLNQTSTATVIEDANKVAEVELKLCQSRVCTGIIELVLNVSRCLKMLSNNYAIFPSKSKPDSLRCGPSTTRSQARPLGSATLTSEHTAPTSSPTPCGMLQSGTAYRSLGFEDENLGSSPGWWVAIVTTYYPSRLGELPKFLSSKLCERSAAPPCNIT